MALSLFPFCEGSKASPKFQFSWSSKEHIRIRSTRACFGHISLIRTRNHAPFLLLDSLLIEKLSKRISEFLSIGPISWELAQLVQRISVKVHFGVDSNKERSSLFWSYLPHLDLKSCTVFFLDSLLFKKYSIKILYFFSTDSTGWNRFSWIIAPTCIKHCFL